MLPGTPRSGLNLALLVAGMAISGVVVVWAFILSWRLPQRWTVIAAAAAACLHDWLSYIHPIDRWFALLPGSSAVVWFHSTFHSDVTLTHMELGFATQVIGAGLCVLTRKKRKS